MAGRDLRRHAIQHVGFAIFWLLMIAFWWDGVDPATRRFVLVTVVASTHMSVSATLFMLHRERKPEEPSTEGANR